MTPNFALNLSEDGIVLLHRHPSGAGWIEVGEAPLDSADLGADIATLRDKAEALEGPGFATKLILPPSQLLYATITVEGDTEASVEHALTERTPYTAAQLNYDISGTPPEVQVVAVARETLEEAEAFLSPYGFNAVGFTALPDPSHFDGSPNLGPLPSHGGVGKASEDGPFKILSPEEAASLTVAAPPAKPDTADSDASAKDTSDKAVKEDRVKEQDDPPTEDPVLPVTPAAAFSSRRKPVLGPATSAAGEIVTSRAPRIAIPTGDPKKPPTSKKPPKVEPRIKTGEAAKKKQTPPIVPPPATKTLKPKPDKPANAGPSRLGQGVAAWRAKAKKAKEQHARPAVAQNVSPPSATKPDPIAELAARQAAGKPRFLGLILTGVLIVLLLLFAAFSSYLLPDNAVTRFFGGDAPENEIVEPELAQTPAIDNNERLASLPTAREGTVFTIPSEEELAEAETPEPEILPLPAMTQTEAETAYAVSGVWQMAPDLRPDATLQDLDELYESSLDPDLAFEDAPALASFDAEAQALDFQIPSAPPPASILFNLDSRGLVRPSPEGSENPEGILVFSGQPPILALQRPDGLAADAPEDSENAADIVDADAVAAVNPLAGFKPVQRPDDIQERFERATQGGRSRAELAQIRPQIRPASAKAKARADAIARALAEADAGAQDAQARAEAEAAAQAELDKPTAQAVARSLRPGSRPRNFANVVALARRTPPEDRNPAAAASTAAVARGTGPAVARASRAAPTGTTRATVARAATDSNAIALGKVALVGVFGTSSNRRALVRMPNGRFKKVGVGDSVDGGRVAAIGEGQLKYTKGGRTVTLEMPKG